MSGSKLNIKRVRDTAIWSVLILGIGALTVFSIRRKANAAIKTVEIEVVGIMGEQKLITEKDIKKILMETVGKPLTKTNINNLNLRKLESKLNKDKRIERADIYFDSKGILHVVINQKAPLFRVSNESVSDYYIDIKGKQVPMTLGSAVRVPIVTGISEVYNPSFLVNNAPSKLREIYHMMIEIQKDPFLSSLIEQIHVEADSIGDIILIPKIGREKLIVGNATNMEEKFDKLKIFYRDGLPRLGWNRYSTLNLKYTAQVTGTLANPLTKKIKPVEEPKDSLQTAMAKPQTKSESIHH
jgi:cell division protein FtsQ